MNIYEHSKRCSSLVWFPVQSPASWVWAKRQLFPCLRKSHKTCNQTYHPVSSSMAMGNPLQTDILNHFSGKIIYTLGIIGIANGRVWFPKGTYGTALRCIEFHPHIEQKNGWVLIGDKQHPWLIRNTGYSNETSTSVAWIVHPKIEESWNCFELLHKYSHNSSLYRAHIPSKEEQERQTTKRNLNSGECNSGIFMDLCPISGPGVTCRSKTNKPRLWHWFRVDLVEFSVVGRRNFVHWYFVIKYISDSAGCAYFPNIADY
jgi:hypothetical protein